MGKSRLSREQAYQLSRAVDIYDGPPFTQWVSAVAFFAKKVGFEVVQSDIELAVKHCGKDRFAVLQLAGNTSGGLGIVAFVKQRVDDLERRVAALEAALK